jgi:glutathione S-transferase
MSIRIHYNPASQHSRRVRMAALELGTDIDWKLVDLGKGEGQAPEYLALNPNGKVPTMEDGGFVLWESNAIMAYLADKKPEKGLYPVDAQKRADVNHWLFWESAHFGPACFALVWERLMKAAFFKQEADPTLLAQGEQNFARFAGVLNGHLANREYVTGALSIADLALASILSYDQGAKIDLEPYPNVKAWFGRMTARDSWKQTPTPF